MTRLHILTIVLFIFLAASATAQQATITATDQTPVATKMIVSNIDVNRDCTCAFVEVVYQNASSSDLTRTRYAIPADPLNPGTELQTFIGALISVRTGETGVNSRKANFRVLGYLVDAGRITGVTLVP